jgi:uncharacterized protein involved in exopolysaccharide biosynthesis
MTSDSNKFSPGIIIPKLRAHPILLSVCTAVGVSLGFFTHLRTPQNFVSTARIMFAGSSSSTLGLPISLGGGSGLPRMDSALGFGQNRPPNSDIVTAIFLSDSATQAVIEKNSLQTELKLPKDLDKAISVVQKKSLVVRKIRTAVLEVSFKANRPDLAKACVEDYLSFCENYTSKNAVTSTRRTRLFIDTKIAENSKEIAAATGKLNAFLKENAPQILKSAPDVGGKILMEVSKARLDSEARAVAMEARLNALHSKSASALDEAASEILSPIVSQDPLASETQKSLVAAELELSRLEMTKTSAHPEVKVLRTRVQGLRAQLMNRIEDARRAVDAENSHDLLMASVESESAVALKNRLGEQLQAAEQSLRFNSELSVKQQMLQKNLESLLKMQELLNMERARARIAEEQDSLKLEMLDNPSLPIKPVWPKLSTLVLVGGLAGLLVGSVLALLRKESPVVGEMVSH